MERRRDVVDDRRQEVGAPDETAGAGRVRVFVNRFDGIAVADARVFDIVMDSVNDWLSARLSASVHDKDGAARVAVIWSDLNAAAREIDTYNLDRKPLIFRTFGRLADAVRG